jgi:putative protein-disulfide isomerase
MTTGIHVTYFTDPLCCWSWAAEPQMRKLRFHFRNHVTWENKFGGLIPSWDNFIDETNAVSRPAQMGPVWFHAEKVSGMPMAHKLWAIDPPASSFPACIAVKCVSIQSLAAGERYLRLLREACMIHGANIAKKDVLIRVAEPVVSFEPSFDMDVFQNDLTGINGRQLLRSDLEVTKQWEVTRMPTLIIRSDDKTIRVSGVKSYATLERAVTTLRRDLAEIPHETDVEAYRQHWSGVLEAEEREFLSSSSRSVDTANTPV